MCQNHSRADQGAFVIHRQHVQIYIIFTCHELAKSKSPRPPPPYPQQQYQYIWVWVLCYVRFGLWDERTGFGYGVDFLCYIIMEFVNNITKKIHPTSNTGSLVPETKSDITQSPYPNILILLLLALQIEVFFLKIFAVQILPFNFNLSFFTAQF